MFQIKDFTTHNNGKKGFLSFCLKILYRHVVYFNYTLKAEFFWISTWLACPLCHSVSEDFDHLWTCPYIFPDVNPNLIFYARMTFFHDACIAKSSKAIFLSDTFVNAFSTLYCWDFKTLLSNLSLINLRSYPHWAYPIPTGLLL